MWRRVRGFLSYRLADAVLGLCDVFYFLLLFFVVSFSLSSGIIRAPPPYRMVNAGLCDHK